MIHLEKITNPVFNDEHGLSINIICDIDGIGNDIPFTAMKNDCEEHGRVLYERALSGDYGSISKFVKKSRRKTPDYITDCWRSVN